MSAREECRAVREWLAARPDGEFIWLSLLARFTSRRVGRLIREEVRLREVGRGE